MVATTRDTVGKKNPTYKKRYLAAGKSAVGTSNASTPTNVGFFLPHLLRKPTTVPILPSELYFLLPAFICAGSPARRTLGISSNDQLFIVPLKPGNFRIGIFTDSKNLVMTS